AGLLAKADPGCQDATSYTRQGGTSMRKLFVLLALGMLGAALLATTGSAATSTRPGACAALLPTKMGRFSGIISAQAISGPTCTGDPTSSLGASPPLLWGGGPRMGPAPAVPVT